MTFVEMPPPRPGDDDRQRPVGDQPVDLALRRGELQPATDGVEQGHLPADDVRPVWSVCVLQVGQPHLRAGVQRVDRHLRLRWPGDFDAPINQICGRSRNGPVRAAYLFRVGQEVQPAGAGGLGAAMRTGCQQLVAPVTESPMQLGHEGQRIVGQIVARPRDRGPADLDARGFGHGATHCSLPFGRNWSTVSTRHHRAPTGVTTCPVCR
jgi:hypothetical protein